MAKEATEKQVERVEDWVTKIRKRRDQEVKDTDADRKLREKAYAYVESDQWKQNAGENDRIRITMNRIYKKVLHLVGLATRAKPICQIVAREDADLEKEAAFKALYEFTVDEGSDRETIETAIWDQHVGGLGVAEEVLDRSKNWPFGELELKYRHPDELHIDINARPREQYRNVGWIIKDDFLSVTEVEAQYPDKAKEILSFKPTTEHSPSPYGSAEEAGSPTTTTDYPVEGGKPAGKYDEEEETQKYLFCTMHYVKNEPLIAYISPEGESIEKEAYEALSEEEQDNYEKITGTERQMWRCIACMDSNTLVLEPEQIIEKHGEYPYIFFIYFARRDKVLPVGMVHFMMSLQDMYNRLNSLVIMDAIQNVARGFIGDDGAIQNPEDLKLLGTEPNIFIRKDPQADFDLIKGGQLSEGVLTLATVVASQIEDVSYPNIASGDPPFRMSGKAMAGVREDALTRLLLADQSIERAMIHHGRDLRLPNIQQFMREERAFRITDRLGRPQFLEINGSPAPPAVPPQPGQEQPEQQAEPIRLYDVSTGKFDFKYQLGIREEEQKRETWELAIALRDRESMDREGLLEASQIRNWKEILGRMDQKDAEMAQQNQALQLGEAVMQNQALFQAVQQALAGMQAQGGQRGQ